MSDYIKREDALKAIGNFLSREDDYFVDMAKGTIKLIPSADVAPKWIPCEDRLPEPNLAVLGYAPEFDNIYAVYYDSVSGWMTWSPVYDEPFPSCQGEIVAWMPLPEPYEGERKDDE